MDYCGTDHQCVRLAIDGFRFTVWGGGEKEATGRERADSETVVTSLSFLLRCGQETQYQDFCLTEPP